MYAVNLQIIPALRKYAVEKGEAGNVPVVISTCFPEEGMCTHYAVGDVVLKLDLNDMLASIGISLC